MDTISIDGLVIETRIGVPDAERARPQSIWVSLELSLDTRDAARGDDVMKSVDYGAVAAEVHKLAAVERRTLERLTEDIAETVLTTFPIKNVRVWVSKEPADLPGVRASVSITRP